MLLNEEKYDDMGNWSGSMVMMSMMFKCKEDANNSILRLLDQSGCHEEGHGGD